MTSPFAPEPVEPPVTGTDTHGPAAGNPPADPFAVQPPQVGVPATPPGVVPGVPGSHPGAVAGPYGTPPPGFGPLTQSYPSAGVHPGYGAAGQPYAGAAYPAYGYAPSTGYTFAPRPVSRTAEMILGILGGVIGLGAGLFAIGVQNVATETGVADDNLVGTLGVAAIIISILGIVAAVSVTRKPIVWGWVLIACAVGVVIAVSLFGVIPGILMLIAGLMAVIRK